MLGTLAVLPGERGCRAMWTLGPLPSPGAPVVVDGLVSCTSNSRFDSSQGIACGVGLLHLPKDVMVLFVRNRSRKMVVHLEKWELLFQPAPSVPLGEQSSSPVPSFPGLSSLWEYIVSDSRGLRSKIEGKCVCIVWGYGFFTLIAGWLISSFSKVKPGLEVTGFRICILYSDGCVLF